METIEKEKALDVVRQMVADGQVSQDVAEKYFPELKESEDEKIRKALKEYFINSFQNNGVAAICGVHIKDILAFLEKQDEQEPVEDRYMEGYLNGINDALKTLKPAAWSEEDEEIIDYLIDYLESELDSSYTDLDKETFTKEINWLKSLRPHQQWKPSDEKMEYLAKAITTLGDEGNCKTASILNDLRVELKKLREE